jgi:hypothetical protein
MCRLDMLSPVWNGLILILRRFSTGLETEKKRDRKRERGQAADDNGWPDRPLPEDLVSNLDIMDSNPLDTSDMLATVSGLSFLQGQFRPSQINYCKDAHRGWLHRMLVLV